MAFYVFAFYLFDILTSRDLFGFFIGLPVTKALFALIHFVLEHILSQMVLF